MVLWRDHIRCHHLPSENCHWSFPDADLRPKVPNLGHQTRPHHLRPLHYILSPFDDIPMLPSVLLLAGRARRDLSLSTYHCKVDLRSRNTQCGDRLDIRHSADLPGVEPQHEPADKDLGSSHSSLRCYVRCRISIPFIQLLTSYSGSTATIIRMPYIWSLATTNDFLWDNTDVSIWSTIEPGMGITASSMACLRPLFQAFLSRSRLLGSSTHGRAGWGAARAGYVRNNTHDRNGSGIPLGNSAKATARGPRSKPVPALSVRAVGDLEQGRDDPELVQGYSATSTTLTEHDSWNKRSHSDDSGDEVGRIRVTDEVRVEVVRSNV
jgi:hypothetical protein